MAEPQAVAVNWLPREPQGSTFNKSNHTQGLKTFDLM